MGPHTAQAGLELVSQDGLQLRILLFAPGRCWSDVMCRHVYLRKWVLSLLPHGRPLGRLEHRSQSPGMVVCLGCCTVGSFLPSSSPPHLFLGAQNWKKFGNSEFDPPGPNVATTTVSDDVSMTFITSKEVSRVKLEPEKRRGSGVGRT